MPPARWVCSGMTDGSERLSGLVSRSAVNFTGLIVGTAAQFGVVLVLTRTLAPSQAGVFLIGYAIFRIAVSLFGFGTNIAGIRYVALARGTARQQSERDAARTVLILAAVGGILGAILLGALSTEIERVFHAPGLRDTLWYLGYGLPLSTFTLAAGGVLRGASRTASAIVVDQVLENGLRLAGLIAGLSATGTATGAAIGFTAGGIASSLSAATLSHEFWRRASFLSGSELSELLRFSAYQWGTILTGTALLWADSVLLGLWKSPADVAVYSAATRAIWLGMVFVLPIGMAFQPMIAELGAVGDFARLRDLYRTATRLSTAIACPPLLLTGVCAEPLLRALYGDKYAAGATALSFLAVGQAVNAAVGPAGQVITMLGRTDVTFWLNSVGLVSNVGLNSVLIPEYGITGAGAAWCLSLVLLCILRLVQCRSEIGIKIRDAWLIRVGIAITAGVCVSAAIVIAADGRPAVVTAEAFVVGLATAYGGMALLGRRPRMSRGSISQRA